MLARQYIRVEPVAAASRYGLGIDSNFERVQFSVSFEAVLADTDGIQMAYLARDTFKGLQGFAACPGKEDSSTAHCR